MYNGNEQKENALIHNPTTLKVMKKNETKHKFQYFVKQMKNMKKCNAKNTIMTK